MANGWSSSSWADALVVRSRHLRTEREEEVECGSRHFCSLLINKYMRYSSAYLLYIFSPLLLIIFLIKKQYSVILLPANNSWGGKMMFPRRRFWRLRKTVVVLCGSVWWLFPCILSDETSICGEWRRLDNRSFSSPPSLM